MGWILSTTPRALNLRERHGRGQLKCDDTRAETRFRLSTKRTSPFKLAGASVQSTTGSRGVAISGSNAGYTTFRDSVKGTGYPLHSSVSPSLPHPCVTLCHHISTGIYPLQRRAGWALGPVWKDTEKSRHHRDRSPYCNILFFNFLWFGGLGSKATTARCTNDMGRFTTIGPIRHRHDRQWAKSLRLYQMPLCSHASLNDGDTFSEMRR